MLDLINIVAIFTCLALTGGVYEISGIYLIIEFLIRNNLIFKGTIDDNRMTEDLLSKANKKFNTKSFFLRHTSFYQRKPY